MGGKVPYLPYQYPIMSRKSRLILIVAGAAVLAGRNVIYSLLGGNFENESDSIEIISFGDYTTKETGTRSDSVSVPETLACSLQYIRQSASNASNPITTCPDPWADSGKNLFKKGRYERFPCNNILRHRNHGQKPLMGCGPPGEYKRWTHPLGWECRLKERLHSTIIENSLSECAFGVLDIGTAGGDWVIALSGFKKARFAVVEAHPVAFPKMLRQLKVNDILDEGRVSAYPFAIGDSNNSTSQHLENRGTKISWPNSEFIQVSSWPGSTLCIPHTEESNTGQFQTVNLTDSCKETETSVPIISVDMIMADWQKQSGSTPKQSISQSNIAKNKDSGDNGELAFGGLFAVKVDIEGAERDAVKSAIQSFGDPRQGPCQLYFELKHEDEYAEALELLVSLGYTEYVDVDSGLAREKSFPPRGALWKEEGNYEFQLPAVKFEECVDRVRQATCATA